MASSGHTTLAKPTVLVIDDAVDVHRVLKARLRQEDIEIVSAMGGKDAMERLASVQPSLILLDLSMPEMDGFEVLRKLKGAESTINIPVIVLSALTSVDDKVAAFDLGALDYVTKPFEVGDLRVRVRSGLRLSRLLNMLSQRAQIDGLTGLWNRAHFDRRFAEDVAAATRHARPLSLAMIDVDHFKSINDTFGHPAGDAVLQVVGQELQAVPRQSDVACRYGGEEFALILPETTPGDAQVLCERLRASIEALEWPRHPERKVTVSIGVCGATNAPKIEAAQWVEAADKNLYAAKKSGRNRVQCTELSEGAPMRLAG